MDNETTATGGATPPTPDPAGGAMPSGQQNPAQGATPQAGSSEEGARPDTSLGDPGKEALDRERTARREADRKFAEAQRRVAELEDAGKSENERTKAALERAEARVAELTAAKGERELLDLKGEVAAEAGLPPSVAPRLQGADKRTLKADAQKLVEDLAAGQPVGDLGIGRGGAATGQPGRVDMNQLIREAAGRG